MNRAVDALIVLVAGLTLLCVVIGLTTDSPTAWPSAFSCLTSLFCIIAARVMVPE